MKFVKINIKKYKGYIPSNADLIIAEKSNINKNYTLLGFDEVYDFINDFKETIFGFMYWN